MEDLLIGELKELLRIVKLDDTLCLEIREGYINVYYRGGCLFKVDPGNPYDFDFSDQYFGARGWPFPKPAPNDVRAWLAAIPRLKAEIDAHFTRSKDEERKENGKDAAEREVQQLILRDNTNSRISNEVEYFITDIEYAGQGFRFDMIAAKWRAVHRPWGHLARLAILEVKYGEDSIRGDCGLEKHTRDVIRLLENPKTLDTLIDETNTLAKQKRELGLFPQFERHENTNEIAIPKGRAPQKRGIELIFILVNTNPRSGSRTSAKKSNLQMELDKIQEARLVHELNALGCKLYLARASYMGYGLYADCMEEIKPEPPSAALAD